MYFCKLFDENETELEQICIYQRFCNAKGKYELYNDKECKSNK